MGTELLKRRFGLPRPPLPGLPLHPNAFRLPEP